MLATVKKALAAVIPRFMNSAAYEGATQGRRGNGWNAPGGGPNNALNGNLPTLRNRSRAAYRNNPWLSLGIDKLVSNEVGTGITARSLAEDETFRQAANALWAKSVEEFDPEGVLNFYGMQTQASRARNVSGEVFIRRRRRRLSDGLAVPVQIQILESEFVPADKSERLPNGNIIVAGIEFNRKGKRVAYHMYTDHPADRSSFDNRLIRVPASDVIHHYLPTRPGQVRGEPVTVQSLLKAHTFDSYDDAELVRKQTRAPFTGFLYREQYSDADYQYDPISGDPITVETGAVPEIDAQPGNILTGLPGEKLDLFSGDDTGQGYADFMRQQLLAIAAGAGIPYEILTGDWSKVNDRLVRAILNDFHRSIEAMQDQLMIFQVCRGVWGWWMNSAVLSGALTAPHYATDRDSYIKHEWRPQGWAYVNPVQDVQAKLEAIAGGLTSRDAEVAKTGWDAEDIDKQNAEAEKRRRDAYESVGLDPSLLDPKQKQASPPGEPNDDK